MSANRVTKVSIPQDALRPSAALLEFDYGGALYRVFAFDFNAPDGGALGVWRQGDDFCARISLDALAEFNREAKDMTTGESREGES